MKWLKLRAWMQLWRDVRFFRYLIIGGINTVFSYTLYALLVLTGMHFRLAVLCSTVIGVLFNFQTTGRFVFQNSNRWRILGFVTVYFITYWVNVTAIGQLIHLGIGPLVAGAATVFPIAILAYTLQKIFVFRS